VSPTTGPEAGVPATVLELIEHGTDL